MAIKHKLLVGNICDLQHRGWIDHEWFDRVRGCQFYMVLCEIELSPLSRAHFVDQKTKQTSISFGRFWCEIQLSLQSRAHFVDHFPDPGAHRRKQTPSSSDHGQPLYPKNAEFCARECFQPWIHMFPNAHTWWCGWHDGATASCDNRS